MGGRGHCVLVVEDNEDVGRFSTELLQDLATGSNGWERQEALAILAGDELAFDLVFSDVIMPGMNGVELATVIREALPRSAGVRQAVIAASWRQRPIAASS